MQIEHVEKADLLNSIELLENPKTAFEKSSDLLDAINVLLKFCVDELSKDGRIKVGIFDIPKVWKAAKIFIESILNIWGPEIIIKKLELIGKSITIGDILVSYVIWCFQNILTPDNKIKINLLKAIPFIVRTIKMVKEITETFKSKGLING